ncbi:GSCOCG00010362001-RA-CDS, partial [Cotesia congregata]
MLLRNSKKLIRKKGSLHLISSYIRKLEKCKLRTEMMRPELSNVIIRLGGFHLIMSFLGVIGNIMEGSGLKEIFVLNYAENSTPKILNGHHYARAVRAHLLTINSLISVLFNEMEITDEEKLRLKATISDVQHSLDALINNEEISNMADKFQRHLDSVSERGKTA